MDMLQNLLGGGQGRQQIQDFTNRYDQGAPWDGISDQEAIENYQRIAPNVPPQVFQESAEQAFSRLSPQQRLQLGQYLQQQTRQQGHNFPDLNRDGIDDRLQDPRYLAQVTGQIQQQQPNLLGQILGGAMGGGGMGGGGMMGGGGGGIGALLNNPIAKAALAGIAANAARNMLSRR